MVEISDLCNRISLAKSQGSSDPRGRWVVPYWFLNFKLAQKILVWTRLLSNGEECDFNYPLPGFNLIYYRESLSENLLFWGVCSHAMLPCKRALYDSVFDGIFRKPGWPESGIKLYFSVPVVFKHSRTTAAYETKHIVLNFLVLGYVIYLFYERASWKCFF